MHISPRPSSPPLSLRCVVRGRRPPLQTIARGKQDRLATSRRVALSRVVSACLVITTAASCILLQRSGLVDLAWGRTSVAAAALLWFWSTFTEVYCNAYHFGFYVFVYALYCTTVVA